MGKTIYLRVTEIEQASKSEFATALLTWSPYEDWSADGGVGEYESYGNYRVEAESWEGWSKNQDTTVNDKDFIKPKIYEQNNTEGKWAPAESVPQGVYLYRIRAYRNNQEYEFSSTVTLLR